MAQAPQFLRRFRRAWLYWQHLCHARFSSAPGIIAEPRKVPVVVSLTTIGERLPNASFTIETLLRQTSRPDRLILWIEEKLADEVPALLRRQIRRGLEIRTAEDVGPHTKIIHALKEFPECIIATADDDVLYPKYWLGELLAAHERKPQNITCHRAHRMVAGQAGKLLPYRQWDWFAPGDIGPSFWLFPTGVGGVLYPPNALHPEVLNRDVFRKICPTNDDLWLKAMSLMNNVRCQKVRPVSTEWPSVRGTQRTALSIQNVGEGRIDKQIRDIFEYYNLYSRLPAP